MIDLDKISQIDFEIQKTLCLATSHVKQSDIERLTEAYNENDSNLCVVGESEYGVIVYVNLPLLMAEHGGPSMTPSVILEKLDGEGYSEALFDLLILTDFLDCEYLKLDRDGDEWDELPRFDW